MGVIYCECLAFTVFGEYLTRAVIFVPLEAEIMAPQPRPCGLSHVCVGTAAAVCHSFWKGQCQKRVVRLFTCQWTLVCYVSEGPQVFPDLASEWSNWQPPLHPWEVTVNTLARRGVTPRGHPLSRCPTLGSDVILSSGKNAHSENICFRFSG